MQDSQSKKGEPRKTIVHATKKLPVPEMVTCETPYGMAYCWKCQANGITALGDTRLDAQVKYQEACEREHAAGC